MLQRLVKWISHRVQGSEVTAELVKRAHRKDCHLTLWCDQVRAHAVNVSESGMRLRLPRSVDLREVVTLSDGHKLTIEGRVVWVRSAETGTEVGLQFQDADWRVNRWIRSLDGHGHVEQAARRLDQKALPAPRPKPRKAERTISLGVNLGELSA